MEGKFIVFEGLDGSGSSTQVSLLHQYLTEKGINVHSTKEPTNNPIGTLIRQQLKGQWKSNQECLQLLFAADRAYHLEQEVLPLLKKGTMVISDRYVFSSLAFGSLDCNLKWLKQINSSFLLPDLTLILKVPAEECMKRIKSSRSEIELFEEENKLKKVWKNYEKISTLFKNVKIVDGSKDIQAVFKEVKKHVEKIL